MDEDVEAVVDAGTAGGGIEGCIGFAVTELGVETLCPISQTGGVFTLLLGKTCRLLKQRDVTEFFATRRVLLVVTGVLNTIRLVASLSNNTSALITIVLLAEDGTALVLLANAPRHRSNGVYVFNLCHNRIAP